MPNYIPYDPKQIKLVAIRYADQLQPGTFEFAINHLIDHKLDLSIFQTRYNNDDGGRPAYDPAILLKIILFAYINENPGQIYFPSHPRYLSRITSNTAGRHGMLRIGRAILQYYPHHF